MADPIDDYIRANHGKYSEAAIRRQLLRTGHDSASVDAAFERVTASLRPEIETYLRDHGARYTTKALRAQLISLGHNPAEVDAALAKTEQVRAPQLAAWRQEGSRFWGWTLLINFVVLVATTVLVAGSSYGGLTFIVLGIAMLLALVVTGNIGRSLVHRSGLLVALAIPAVGALLLGGWCFSMMRGSVL